MEVICEYKNIYDDYTCVVTSTTITEQAQKIQSFKGIHHEGKSNADVETVSFEDTAVHYVPRGLSVHFPSMTRLEICNCGLKKVTTQDLQGLEGLTELCLKSNFLNTLPDNLFIGMPNLVHVDFDENIIECASSKLLEPLVGQAGLQVFMQRTYRINEFFSEGDEGSLDSIEELMKIIDEKCLKPDLSDCTDVDDFNVTVKHLWTSSRFSDFTIFAGTKQFKVHKAILGMKSSVFAKVFEDHIDATEIKLSEFSASAVESLLHFIYTKEVLTDENAKEIFSIAAKFEMQKMKSICEKMLCDQLEESNAFELFTLGHLYSAEVLKKEAFNVVASTLPDDLPEGFMENPEKLKKLINARREYLKVLKD